MAHGEDPCYGRRKETPEEDGYYKGEEGGSGKGREDCKFCNINKDEGIDFIC